MDIKVIMNNEFENKNSERHKAAKPPKQSYYFFPSGKDLIEWDPRNPKKTMRRVFEAQKYNDFEKSNLDELQKLIDKHNETYPDKQLIYTEDWSLSSTLRFLQATGYDHLKTINILIDHMKWRRETLPIVPTDHIKEILNLGFIYGHGRDTKYRPIYLLNVIIYKKNASRFSSNDWILSLIYFLEYMIGNMLIPGQIENWNIICDLNNISVVFPPNDFKILMNVLQSNYRCRLFTMYILNVSTAVRMIWLTIKKFLDPNTEKKIKILTSENFNELFSHINKENIEEKFGGTAQNINSYFFPPRMPTHNFMIDGVKESEILVPENEYREILKNNEKLIPCPYINSESEYEEANSFTMSEKEKKAKKRKSMITNRTVETVFEDCFEKEIEFNEKILSIGENGVTPQDLKRGESNNKNLSKVRNQRNFLKPFETRVETNMQNTCCHGMKVCQIF